MTTPKKSLRLCEASSPLGVQDAGLTKTQHPEGFSRGRSEGLKHALGVAYPQPVSFR